MACTVWADVNADIMAGSAGFAFGSAMDWFCFWVVDGGGGS